jgi:nucleotide-binding universal stress UspA family protein
MPADSLSIFERVVCGIDETPESLDAVRLAARLLPPGGTLHLIAAVYLAGAIAAGWPEEQIAAELEKEAGDVLRRAVEIAGDAVSSRLVNGPAAPSVLRELEREQATLVCIGSHSRHRLPGALLGYVATSMLHEAPCSVLVARKPRDPAAFPRSIVVGVDGSKQAAAAYTIASRLADHFGATLRPLAASGGKYVDTDALGRQLPDLDVDSRTPVEALTAAAAHADLLVVGSRGLHGLRALGSVSERAAHRANCSVLVIRG